MTKDIFRDRERGEEAAYFRKEDARLIEKLRQKAQFSEIAHALAEKLHADEPALLERIKKLGVTLNTGRRSSSRPSSKSPGPMARSAMPSAMPFYTSRSNAAWSRVLPIIIRFSIGWPTAHPTNSSIRRWKLYESASRSCRPTNRKNGSRP